MLKKWMKYDFLWLEGVLVFLQMNVLVSALLAKTTNALYNEKGTMLTLVVDKIGSNLMFAVMCATFFIAFFRTLTRFQSTVFGRLSYFTHTTPAKRSTVFDAKVLTGMAVNAITLLVIGAGLLLSLWGQTDIRTLFGLDHLKTAVLFCLIIPLEVFAMYLSAVLGLIWGHRFNRNKMLHSVVLSLAVYFAVSGAVACGLGVFIAAAPETRAILASQIAELTGSVPPVLLNLLWVCAACYAAVVPALYFIGRRALGKGVNVD